MNKNFRIHKRHLSLDHKIQSKIIPRNAKKE